MNGVGAVLVIGDLSAASGDLFASAEENRLLDVALEHFRQDSSLNRVRAFLYPFVIRHDMRFGAHAKHVNAARAALEASR